MAEFEAVELLTAASQAQEALAYQATLRADDAAVVRLQAAGADLLDALSRVQRDEAFWARSGACSGRSRGRSTAGCPRSSA
jgi:hypothetical protein